MTKLLANYPKSKVLLRMILFWTVFDVLYFVIFSTLSHFYPLLHSPVQGIRNAITGTLIAFLVTWIFLKFDKQSFRGIGLVWEWDTPFRFIKGILLGTVIFAIIFQILLLCTPLQL